MRLKNSNTRVAIASAMSDRWIGQRLEILSATVILAMGTLATVAKHFGLAWMSDNGVLASVCLMYR